MSDKPSHDTDEVDPLPLSALNGAVLKYEDRNGNTHRIEFDDKRSVDTEIEQNESEKNE